MEVASPTPTSHPVQVRVDEVVPVVDEDAGRSPLSSDGSPASVDAGGDGASCAGRKVSLATGSSPSPASSASIQDEDPWWWPKGLKDGTLSPTSPLSPMSSACSCDSFEGGGQWTHASMFTVDLSRASPPEAREVDVEEGEIVEGAWTSGQFIANPFKRLAAKLTATAKALTSWNDRFIGSNKKQILLANELILHLDMAMGTRALSTEERSFRKLLKRKLLGLASLEQTIARQRSRITSLAEGDVCTTFFHLHANHRHRKNFIAQLKVDGVLVPDQEAKAAEVDSFYELLLGSAPERGFSLDLDFLGVRTHDLAELEAPFSEDEALVSLLPKHADAVEIKDFRPISLIHSVAKLVAKVLSSRLAPRMAELVGPQQSARIQGRCLHDNFQLVQCTTRKLHARKTAAILLKLDITKAFDTVDWAFLLEVLEKLGFGHK
ncbi:hypothetical protein ACQ4PT_025372 [Festuca glaucescens]